MKSKKIKVNSSSPRSSEEDSNHRNAFSFLKNRFFSGNHTSGHSQFQQERTSSPSPSTTSTHSLENTKNEEKPLSRSFDEQSISEFNTSSSSSSIANTPRLLNKSARPLSMMGIDSLLNQQNITDTIQVAEPSTDAFMLSRRNSTTATEVSSHKKSMNKLSLDLQNANCNAEFANTTAKKRTSMIILKEGYLFKKTDFKPFHKQNKLDRGWKLYRVILRGHKLYLYKVTSESPLRSLFPSSSHHQQQLKQLHSNNSLSSRQSLTFSLSSSSIASTNTASITMKMMRSDFDREAQQVFFQSGSAAQGAIFMELNQVSLEPKQQVYLVIFNDLLYICSRPDAVISLWKIEQSIPITQLKLEYMMDMTPTSPISINSMQSDSYSNGPLLFNILHVSSILGVYSTQFRELGQSWITTFQSIDTHKMYDATQQCHPGIIYRDDRSVQGGTIHALVHELWRNDNPTFLHVFLLTYTLFTTGSRVLTEIKSWAVGPDADVPRLLDIFTIWCKEFSLDVMGDVATGMMEILGLLSCEKAVGVKELVLKTVNENVEKTCEPKTHILATIPDEEEDELVDPSIENISAYRVDGKRRDSINLSNLLITGLTPAVFLQIDPLSFAQQIYLFHYTKQKQFYKELLNPLSYLPRPQFSVQMLNSLLFTTVAPHFLTKIIRNQILIDSQQVTEGALFIRSKLLEHWIQVGIDLLDLGDMTGWCAVAMGICSVGVIRLRETWKAVTRDLVNRVQTEWVNILTDYGLFTQDMWAEEWAEPPAKILDPTKSLPFFGALRQYTDRYRKHSKANLSPNIINFEECQCLYNAMTTALSVFDKKKVFEDIDVTAVDPLQSFFEHSVTDMMSVPHDYKYLQECSLACEPKIFGQGRRGKSQGDIVPPSQSCLTFPALLDNCSLFNSKPDTVRSEAKPSMPTRKAVRRRTYSFPPSSNNFASATRLDLLESENSRTWLGSFISNRHHRTYSAKSLMEAHKKSLDASYGPNGNISFTVQQGELVFKASALLFNDTKKAESIHSIEFLKKDGKEDEDALVVSIKAGYLKQLVDSLIYSVSPHEDKLKEQWQLFTIANDFQHQRRPDKVVADEEEYIHVFFMTYRTFCSSANLLDMLRRRFMDAQHRCKPTMKRKNSLTLLENYFIPDTEPLPHEPCDWDKLARIQLRVMDLILYWIQEHPCDFIDEVQITRYMSNFLKNAKASVLSWRALLKPEDGEALETSKVIETRIVQIRDHFMRKSMCPCYDMKAIEFEADIARGVEDLYRQLTSGTQQYHAALQLAANRSMPLSISDRPRDMDAKSLVDTFAPEVLLEQVDQNVRQLFNAVTMQDWIQTFDVFEAQTQDIYAWLPARKPSRTSRMTNALAPVIDGPSSHTMDYHLLPDEVVVSDIFFAIQNARRSVVAPSAFSDDDLIMAFPGSIQYLYCMHFIIRSWVIHEIAAVDIDSKTRVLRIEKFLQIVLLSKMSGERLTLFPELGEQVHDGRVPGFVEYAIASALASPEVRLFTKAWQDVAMQHGHASLDHLEHLLNQIQKMQSHVRQTNKKLSNSTSFRSMVSQLEQCQYLVPSLGWLFERIIELGTHVPDTFENKENLLNMDKRRCMYYLLQLMMNVQFDLDEQQQQQQQQQQKQKEKKSITMSFLLSPNIQRTTWKELREMSIRESKKATGSSSLVLRGSGSKAVRNPIFGKLVAEQMDKLKRDFKEKDRIDKDWLNLQQKMQKKQIEQAKQTERQDKKGQLQSSHNLSSTLQQPYNVMPRINSFLRGLRPQSMVTTPIQHIFPFDQPQPQTQTPSIMKASTVINLIHSTTSVASTYTKREYVFRIVTEEGAQYLFQAMSREDMNDWMQQINTSAREGAAKRQSVLVNETIDSQSMSPVMDRSTNRRMSVYGVGLDELMPTGNMPLIVEKCIQEIEKRGLEEVGIYRVAGTGSVVSALKAAFNKNVHGVDLSDPEWADINVVADAFKQFLRELPEPLLTYSYYDEFITASASEGHDQRIYLFKKVLNKLPFSNYTLLKRIVEHFVIVTDFEATNHMYATNLAIVFGPTLLQPSPGPTSFATTMSNLGHHQNIVKYLILNYHYLFDVESDEVEPSKEEEDQK